MQRDSGVCDGFALHADALFGFNRLMQPVGVAPPVHQAAGEFVNDNHFAVLHHIIAVALEDGVRLERVLGEMHKLKVLSAVDVADIQHPFQLGDAFVCERGGAVLFVYGVVILALQRERQAREALVLFGGLLRRPADDKRRARFVYQDVVHLVNDSETAPALDAQGHIHHHIIAQIVEAELVVRAVGDVGGVSLVALHAAHVLHPALRRFGVRVEDVRRFMLQYAHGYAEEVKDFAHPLGVPPCQVIVDRNDVNAFAADGVEIRRQRRRQRLAFAGSHFGYLALMQRNPAYELRIEVAHAQRALGRLAHRRECFGQDVVHRSAAVQPRLELGAQRAEFGVGQALEIRLQIVDFGNHAAELLDCALIRAADKFRERFQHWRYPL